MCKILSEHSTGNGQFSVPYLTDDELVGHDKNVAVGNL